MANHHTRLGDALLCEPSDDGVRVRLHGRPLGRLSGKLWTVRPVAAHVLAEICALLGCEFGGVDPLMWPTTTLGDWQGELECD